MAPRLELQTLLETFTPKVYFQPPTNVQLVYPCIIYERDQARTNFADDRPYKFMLRYSVMVIDPNPDSIIPSKVAAMPISTFNRFFTVNNLNHDVYNVYF